jgi:two-component system, sensor histidine kinase and response regulator
LTVSSTDPTNAQPVKILIAEDSATQAERLKYTLENQGYLVTVTGNGREALRAARVERPTLLISDVIMPEMDGFQLCQAVKSDPELGGIPVILVTTLSDPHDVIRGLECRADNFVMKPYDDRYLLSRIRFVLVNSDLRDREQSSMGVEIYFNGRRHFITADRLQILNLLLSTYEAAIQRNQELNHARNELQTVNAALETANGELESFSYSVSHDLRAPLRVIDGFSQALLEDYADKLDQEGKENLQRVRAATRRMGELIDDMLNLSRVTRSEMRLESVNLSELAQTIAAELQRSQPDRRVEFVIAEGMVVNGDQGLLKVALENLLGNAWKFTGKRSEANIKFGMTEGDGKRVYFVRDNGSGFDMAYANRLFGAFQRLHDSHDFAGTGIGLATVQRVIHRHGGQIWAEAEVAKGATFYFTLTRRSPFSDQLIDALERDR